MRVAGDYDFFYFLARFSTILQAMARRAIVVKAMAVHIKAVNTKAVNTKAVNRTGGRVVECT
jgi:hypothetical protein